ncbi:MAG: flagellar basal body rod protein [Caulobacteraceae bacterium]|jgi:flagellar basal-body rod protein FlgF|nr:flagellar basal body rod protein [Caulobacteraceae bacterium]
MNNALYVGLSRQMTLQREMDVIANNFANSDTVGFKVETLKLETDTQTPVVQAGGARPSAINFVRDVGVDRDYSQGALRQTGGTFDLGLQGDGFFQVNTPNGLRYTRDGRFSLDAKGQVVNLAGDTLQGAGGSPIVIDPLKGAPSIARDGTITQIDPKTTTSTVVGKVGAVTFADPTALQKTASGQYDNVSNLAAQPARATSILQGMLENSNVDSIQMMARMIAVSRAYESVANMMSQTGDTSDQSIQRLGRVN